MIIIPEEPHLTNGLKNQITCLKVSRKPSAEFGQIPYHFHDCIEILYALDADCEIWINKECQKFSSGDMVIINSNEPHYVYANQASEYICIQFSTEILYSGENYLEGFKYIMPFLFGNSKKSVFSRGEIKKAGELCSEIIEEWEKKESAYELIIRGNILKLFAEIIRYLKETELYNLNDHFTDEIKKSIIYISENYSSATEKAAAGVAGLSYNHFSYLFKKQTGKKFKEYLNEVRIGEGEKLLLSTTMSITEIAMSTGFSSASHFIASFKNQKGITPLKFRLLITKEKI